jgi:threonine/homoserine/homoserine lactone efflux protein
MAGWGGWPMLCGSLFDRSLAYQNLCTMNVAATREDGGSRSLAKGVLVNTLSPHPYLFWLTVGAPTIVKPPVESRLMPVLFVSRFWGCEVRSKVCVAVLAGGSGHRRNDCS